jgi:alpha-beta hydrolase superfamily lysophospholipase
LAESLSPCTVEEFQAGDGYRWRYRRYASEGARAEIVFIHGIQSHGGWYQHSCNELARAGFNVYFLDRRGSGLNPQGRGDSPGGFRRLLDDLAEFLTHLTKLGPPLTLSGTGPLANATGEVRRPIFLAAISWGGKLAVALERRHPGLVDGLALICPGFFAKVRPTLTERLLIILNRLFRPRKLFQVPLSDPELFTTSPDWQRFLREDPQRLTQATARLLVESVRLDGYLRFVPKYVHVPVLLLLAEQDRIIHNGKTRTFVDRFATPDRQIIEYPGAHHTLEFEPEPGKFIMDLRTWFERQIQAKSKPAV